MASDKGYKIRNQYGLHFLTSTVVGWVDIFTRKECKDILIESLRYCQINKGLVICAYVIMESHIHIITRASEGQTGLSEIIRDFKRFTSKALLNWIKNDRKESRSEWLEVVFMYHAKYNKRNTKYQIWQQDNQPKELLHPKFTQQKIDYIHNNPVVSGIVDKADEYLYSSARNYIGRQDFLLPVHIIDYGVQEGYIFK